VRREALLWGVSLALALVAVGLVVWSRSVGRSATTPESPFTEMDVVRVKGEPDAPDFSLPTLEGRTVTLSSLRGQVVFLNFWATWCLPCREEMPSIERLHRALGGQGLVVLAVDVDENPRLVAKFMKDFGLSFPALLDAGSEVSSRYGVRGLLGLPTTMLVDRRGRIVGAAIGPRDWGSPTGQALILSLLEQK
jgi:cytochrome c biogenesis protein CcmG/thiol:disulfide interchange protein DsbE